MAIRRILLIQPVHEKLGPRRRRTGLYFPYGLGYVAAVLQNAGFEIDVLDCQALQISDDEIRERIRSSAFDAVGIGAFSTQFGAVRWMADYIKAVRGDVPIVLGGPMATHSWRLSLDQTKIDFAVLGEGEETAVDLFTHIDHPERVHGIALRDGGTVRQTPDRPYIEDLDTLPQPPYDLFPMEVYAHGRFMAAGRKWSHLRVMTVITSRGCRYHCRFCSKNFTGLRLHSIDRVMADVRHLVRTYRLQGIHFQDELFASSRQRMEEFCPRMKTLGIPWDAQARVDIVDAPTLRLMKEAGCVAVGFGIESGSQRMLRAMRKGIRVDQTERAFAAAQNVGLEVKVQLIFGFPGEDEESLRETVELFKRLHHPGRRMNLMTPLPGTDIYDECVADGRIPDEAEYLCKLERSFGQGQILVNFTTWPDEELYPIKARAERAIIDNYKAYLRSRPALYLRHLVGQAARRVHNHWPRKLDRLFPRWLL